MNTVWKWALAPGSNELQMPLDSQVLTVQMQGETPCLWALVDDNNDLVWRTFAVYGTGRLVRHDHGKYIGTFQMNGGALVWHVFEVPNAD